MFFLSFHVALFTAAECSHSASVKPEESITSVASGCHNNVKVASGVYACGDVYKAAALLAGISLHTADALSETCVCVCAVRNTNLV